MTRALFPGSFDPITTGHVEIIERVINLFDEIVVAIGDNSQKSYLFSLEERMEMLRLCFENQPKIKTTFYQGLTVEFARSQKIQFLLRGIRNDTDLSYERPIELINKHLNPDIETIYLFSRPTHVHVSSSLVREVIKYRGKISGLVPDEIVPYILSIKYAATHTR